MAKTAGTQAAAQAPQQMVQGLPSTHAGMVALAGIDMPLPQSPLSAAVTYFPKLGGYMAGVHIEQPTGLNPPLIASTVERQGLPDVFGNPTTDRQVGITHPGMMHVAQHVQENSMAVANRALVAANYESNATNLNNLVLIKLYNKIMGDLHEFFFLDAMFMEHQAERLQLRVPFMGNPAFAKITGRRQEYDTTRVEYQDIELYLQKLVTSWEIPLEDKLRALIDPIVPQVKSNQYAIKYHREQEAADALGNIGNYYTKSATGSAKFTATTAPANNNDARISNPDTRSSSSGHSEYDVVTEIQEAANDFMLEYNIPLTHYACHPTTAMHIARNTRTENNTIFNVEAYRTGGGVRSFPGLASSTMVMSLLLPQNMLYAVSMPAGPLIRAEGPKITQSWQNHDHFSEVSATLDFHQYKCVHEDFPSTFTRKFAVIIPLSTA